METTSERMTGMRARASVAETRNGPRREAEPVRSERGRKARLTLAASGGERLLPFDEVADLLDEHVVLDAVRLGPWPG